MKTDSRGAESTSASSWLTTKPAQEFYEREMSASVRFASPSAGVRAMFHHQLLNSVLYLKEFEIGVEFFLIKTNTYSGVLACFEEYSGSA